MSCYSQDCSKSADIPALLHQAQAEHIPEKDVPAAAEAKHSRKFPEIHPRIHAKKKEKGKKLTR